MREKVRETWQRIGKDLAQYKIVILLFLIYYVFMHIFSHAFCLMVLVSGFPCAGCGMTRAVFFMLTGQFARSYGLNKMALPVVVFAIYCFWWRYVLGKKIKGFSIVFVIIMLGMLGTYLYGMITVFPDKPPYTYTRGSLFEKIIPNYIEYLRKLLHI